MSDLSAVRSVLFLNAGLMGTNPPARYSQANVRSVASFFPGAARLLDRYVLQVSKHLTDCDLVLVAEHGHGKTHTSIALVREMGLAGLSAIYVTAYDMVQALLAEESHQGSSLMSLLSEYDFLMVDDFGMTLFHDLDFEAANRCVAQVLEARYANGKVTGFATSVRSLSESDVYGVAGTPSGRMRPFKIELDAA